MPSSNFLFSARSDSRIALVMALLFAASCPRATLAEDPFWTPDPNRARLEQWLASLGRVMVRAAHPTVQNTMLMRYRIPPPQDGRQSLHLDVRYEGRFFNVAGQRNRYWARIDLVLDRNRPGVVTIIPGESFYGETGNAIRSFNELLASLVHVINTQPDSNRKLVGGVALLDAYRIVPNRESIQWLSERAQQGVFPNLVDAHGQLMTDEVRIIGNRTDPYFIQNLPSDPAWIFKHPWVDLSQEFTVWGPLSNHYNCFGYVLRIANQNPTHWEPTLEEMTVWAMRTLQQHGFSRLDDGSGTLYKQQISRTAQLQKAVVYSGGHIAIQRKVDLDGHVLPFGSITWWESKLGPGPLIAHKSLDSLAGTYGKPQMAFARPWPKDTDLSGGADDARKWWPTFFEQFPQAFWE